MNRTKIEWARNPDGSPGYTWNPITGCLNHQDGLCKGGGFPCYAYKLANGRLRTSYLRMPQSIYDNVGIAIQNDGKLPENYTYESDPFAPRLWGQRLEDKDIWQRVGGVAKRKGIFVSDMGELFGDWVPRQWQYEVFEVIRKCLQHRFYLLTKQPQNLIKFSPFPDNAWVGVTATNANHAVAACYGLQDIEAKVKFLSIEPLLAWVLSGQGAAYPALYQELVDAGIDWLIIGACTGTYREMELLAGRLYAQDDELNLDHDLLILPLGKGKYTLQPHIEWVREIVEAADKVGVKVFLKDNLNPLFNPNYEVAYPWAYDWGQFRQELPEIK